MKKSTTKASKNSKSTKQTTKNKVVAAPKQYSGKPIEATRLYSRKMTEFKNTKAECLLAINDKAGTYTFMNTYKDGILPPSYDPSHYTYQLNEKSEKKLAAKIENMREIEAPDFPAFVQVIGRRVKAK